MFERMVAKLAYLAVALGLGGPPAHAQSATVERNLTVDSPAIGGPIEYSLYLPAAYADLDRRFPVIYLLHGHGGDGTAWLDLGGLSKLVDRMIADGRLPPAIVVMPSARKGWYVDSAAPGGTGRWQTAILDDLSGSIDARYRTLATREGRAIAGYSMGGYGALRFALLEPDRFAAAASLSGALFPDVKSAADFPAFQLGFFGGTFGANFDPKTFNALSPWRSLSADADAGAAPALYMAVGDQDIPILKAGNETFRQALTAAGLPVEYHVVPGGHDWRLWAAQLEPMLAFIGERLRGRASVAQDIAPVRPPAVAPAAAAAVAKAAKDLVDMDKDAAAAAATGPKPVVPRP